MTDEQLFAEFQRTGSTEAFGEIYKRHTPTMMHKLRQFFGNDIASAEDAIQGAFRFALEHTEQYDPTYKVSMWLYGLLLNVAIDMKAAA